LTTNAVNIDYKKSLHDWNIKTGVNGSFQNNFANPATGIKPLIPNFNRVEFGTYGIVMIYLIAFLYTGLRYDYSRVDAAKFYLKSRWRKEVTQLNLLILLWEKKQSMVGKPSFTFHNVSASAGFHKEFAADLNWYSNISLAMRNPNPEFFSDGLHHSTGIIELGDLALDKEVAVKLSTTVQKMDISRLR
jgi:iron complex outermembrane receptor protein